MSPRGEVLVVIMNNRADWAIAREQHWYRLPIAQVEKLKQRQQWAPPQWLAFYQTKVFEPEAYQIQYFAPVVGLREVLRQELFPQESDPTQSQKRYCQVMLGEMQPLPQGIRSDRLRRVTFIATTLEQLLHSQDIQALSLHNKNSALHSER